MTAVPAIFSFDFELQDNRGFKSRVRINGYNTDVSTGTGTVAELYALAAGVGTALGNMSNAKVVRSGFGFEYQLAQEPTSETGTYQLVQDKAILLFGSGVVEKERLFVPAPKDAMFLTTSQDNLIVVNPASSLVTAFQTAMNSVATSDGGIWGAQFFGGQYHGGKPRRRRVLQGA